MKPKQYNFIVQMIEGIEDFVLAKTISELGYRLAFAEKDDAKWSQLTSLIKEAFMYSRLTKSDHRDLNEY